MPDKTSTLQKITNLLVEETGLTPSISSEIEFYLEGNTPKLDTQALFSKCYKRFGGSGILTYSFENEVGEHQYEISLLHLPDPLIAAQNTLCVIDIIRETAKEHDIHALFEPKPFPDRPGCGLHIHVSLHDKEGHNMFRKERHIDEETQTLRYAVAGLCDTMAEGMKFFAPRPESYARFTAEKNDAETLAQYNNAPVNISWGGNNRTVAIRIPTSTLDPEHRHIEHRVAGADANPYEVMAAILAGMCHGLRQRHEPAPKIWGNAFDKQYTLPPLPASLEEAMRHYENGKILKAYL